MILYFRGSSKWLRMDFELKSYSFEKPINITEALSLTTNKEVDRLEKELIKRGFIEE